MAITDNRKFNLGIARDLLARTYKDIEQTKKIVSNKEDIDTLKELRTTAEEFSVEFENTSKEDNLNYCYPVLSELRVAVIDISELPRNRVAKEKRRVKELSAAFYGLEKNAQESLIDGFYSARKKAMSCISQRDFSNIDSHISSMFINYLLSEFSYPTTIRAIFDAFCEKEHLTYEPEKYRKLIKQGKQALKKYNRRNRFEVVETIIKMSQLIATEAGNEMIISTINDVFGQRKC